MDIGFDSIVVVHLGVHSVLNAKRMSSNDEVELIQFDVWSWWIDGNLLISMVEVWSQKWKKYQNLVCLCEKKNSALVQSTVGRILDFFISPKFNSNFKLFLCRKYSKNKNINVPFPPFHQPTSKSFIIHPLITLQWERLLTGVGVSKRVDNLMIFLYINFVTTSNLLPHKCYHNRYTTNTNP